MLPGWYLQGEGGHHGAMGPHRELLLPGGHFGGGGMMGRKKVLRHIPMWKVHVLGSRMWRGVLGVRYA